MVKISEPITPIPAQQLPLLLAQRFIRDYDEVMRHYGPVDKLNITQHFLQVLYIQQQYIKTEDVNIYKQFTALEETLLRYYGKALKPYRDKQFYLYFDPGLVLTEKGIYLSETFNGLPPQEQSLSLSGMEQFISICTHTLQRERDNLLLSGVTVKENTVNDKPDLPLNGKQEDEPDKEATKARQLLAMYYFLKTVGVEHRQSNSVSAIARFIHLLTGTKFTSIQNSDIYKKYLLMPNYKNGAQLIKDLQYIRPYFEESGLLEAVKEIDSEITRCIRELPLAMRKKWQGSSSEQ